MRKLFTSAALALACIAASSTAHAEDIWTVMERAAQSPRPAPPMVIPYKYKVDVRIIEDERKDDTEDEITDGGPFTAQLQIDPSQPAGQQAVVLDASDEDYPDGLKDLLADMNNPDRTAEKTAEAFWCEGSDDKLTGDDGLSPDDFTVISETERDAVIRPNMKTLVDLMMDSDDEDMSKSDRKMAKKMMERLDGEFTISKPDARLRHFKMWMTRPMTIKVIAKIKTMEVEQSCAAAPNGFLYNNEMKMSVTGKALGMKFRQNMHITVSGLEPV